MTETSPLNAILESDAFNPVDRHLANRLVRLSGKDCPVLGLAAALVSRELAGGHSCLSLSAFSGRSIPEGGPESGQSICCPSRADWEKLLLESSVVGTPGDTKPLILDAAGRLYLHRYWCYERAVTTESDQTASTFSGTRSRNLPAHPSGSVCSLPERCRKSAQSCSAIPPP